MSVPAASGRPPVVVDQPLEEVAAAYLALDPDGSATAQVFRDTIDQLYDGQRTGRYRWDQLFKTEKTHCGTLVEINLQRQFGFDDGAILDYSIAGHDVDAKYSQTLYGWMIPPEAVGQLCLVGWADDLASVWGLGLVRPMPAMLRGGSNRDAKSQLLASARHEVHWLFEREPLPPNVLLQLPPATVSAILGQGSGTARLDALFRAALGQRIGRGVIATVAQQADYMKRVRGNGGSRSSLRPEGIIILGPWESHRQIARDLGCAAPRHGEVVAVKVIADPAGTADIGDDRFRLAVEGDVPGRAPLLPKR